MIRKSFELIKDKLFDLCYKIIWMHKGILALMIFYGFVCFYLSYYRYQTMISLCTGCESELSRENMVYWDERTETDFSEVLELSDYIGLPQEEVIKTLNLVCLDGERDDRPSESVYRGSKENAYFFIHFCQGVMQDIWLPVTEDPSAGVCSLAGCDMAMLLEGK